MTFRGIWEALNRNRPLFSTRATLKNPSQWMIDAFGGPASASGVRVNDQSVMQVAAVYACVRVLSETIASLPLNLYRREGDRGREIARRHLAQELVHSMPNSEMTSLEWREAIMGHASLRGAGYTQIIHDQAFRPIGLWPLNPDSVRPFRSEGEIKYEVQKGNGNTEVLSSHEVLPIKGRTLDGINPLSPIAEARETFGSAIGTQEYGNRFFANDANPGGILEHPGALSDEAHARLRKSWSDHHAGVKNARKPAILESGMKWSPITIKPEEAQFLEKRKFDVSDIARIFRVPPHLIQDLERATFSNVEQQGIDFVVHTIRPWVVRWEQALDMKLLTSSERRTFFFKFSVDGLLRGDIESRFKAYAIGRNWGWMSANDVLALEDRNPLPDEIGNIYLTPLNMIPAEKAKDQEPKNIDTKAAQRAAELSRELSASRSQNGAGSR